MQEEHCHELVSYSISNVKLFFWLTDVPIFFFFLFIISSIQTRKFIKLLIHEIFILSNTIG